MRIESPETIRREAEGPVVHLRAGGTSLVVLVDDERLPRILHWGEDLGDLGQAELTTIGRVSLSPTGDSVVMFPGPVPVLAQIGEGWLGRPGLTADSDGLRWAAKFRTDATTVSETDDGVRLTVEARDDDYDIGLALEIDVLHASGLVRQRARLRNERDLPLRVGGVELALPVPSDADEILDFSGRWSKERMPQRRPFLVGEMVRTSRGGKPGLEHTVMVIAGRPGFGSRSGTVWGTHLAWSGNQTLGAERTFSDTRRLVAGEVLIADEVVLSQNETYETPWQYGSWGEGLDELSARFHRHLRGSAAHPGSPRPVSLNTWEAVYMDHDPAVIASLAERAAQIGAERFVVDDGWFVGRRDDTTSLGDWDVDRDRWPDGLEPLADRVRDLGMEFGLWFEPEMVNLESDLARSHPEWLFDAGHGAGAPSRHQHVLDLAHPGAYAHVRDRMSRLIDSVGIAYIKWDHNRYLLDAGHTPDGRAGMRDQTLAAYRLMAELRAAHPGLEIESCASGGGRIDLGVLEHTQRVWPSDCIDPHERMEIYRWTGMLVPPEYQGTHVGSEHSHTTGRTHPLSYRAEKAIWGHMGLEVNLLELDERTLTDLAAWIAFHKAHRELLHTGVVVHADVAEPALRLEGVVATDRSEALFAASLVERPRTWPIGRLRIPGLADDETYRVAVVDPVRSEAPQPSPQVPAWLPEGAVLSGRALRVVGIEAPQLDPDRSVLLKLERVS